MKYEIREMPSVGGGKIQIIGTPNKGKQIIIASLRWVGGLLPQEMIMRQAVKIVENLVNFQTK
jgi:hypothetical protein